VTPDTDWGLRVAEVAEALGPALADLIEGLAAERVEGQPIGLAATRDELIGAINRQARSELMRRSMDEVAAVHVPRVPW